MKYDRKNHSKILCIINHRAGNIIMDWPILIRDFFETSDSDIEIFYLPEDCSEKILIEKIIQFAPTPVIAVGGDGTVKLTAACLIQKIFRWGYFPQVRQIGLQKNWA